jgi:hypothetical protein
LAQFLRVSSSTIALWKETEPSFSEAIRQAKVKTDASVAAKLWQRATGYEVQEEKEFELKDTYYDENGKKLKEEKRTVAVAAVALAVAVAPGVILAAWVCWLSTFASPRSGCPKAPYL